MITLFFSFYFNPYYRSTFKILKINAKKYNTRSFIQDKIVEWRSVPECIHVQNIVNIRTIP